MPCSTTSKHVVKWKKKLFAVNGYYTTIVNRDFYL